MKLRDLSFSRLSTLDKRKTAYIVLGILLVLLAVWGVWRVRVGADVINSARPKILPIDKKNFSVNDQVRLSIYVNDQDEIDMNKMRVFVDWGDGSPVQDQSYVHPENLTDLAGSPILKIIANHYYSNIGSYTITITAQDSTGTKSLPFTVPVQVFSERDTGSYNYAPTISSVTDASVTKTNKEFQYWVEFFDYSDISLNSAKVSIDWGDGDKPTVTEDIQPTREIHPNSEDYKQAIVYKTYAKEGVYLVTITVTDGDGESTQDQMIIIASDAVVNPEILISRVVPKATAGGQYQFEYQLFDNNGSDFSEAYVDWGDGNRDNLPTEPQVDTGKYRSYYQSYAKPGYFNFKTTRLLVFGHTYEQPGTYIMSINVTDSEGGTVKRELVAVVSPGAGLEFEEKFFSPKVFEDDPSRFSNVLPEPWYVVGENYPSYLKSTSYWQYNPLFRWELYNSLNNRDGYAYYLTDRDSGFSTLMRNLSKSYNPKESFLLSEFEFILGGATNQGQVSYGFINSEATDMKNAATMLVIYDKNEFEAYSAFYYDGTPYTKENTSIVQMTLSEKLRRNTVYHGVVELEEGSLTTKILKGDGSVIGESTVQIDAKKSTKDYNAWGVIDYSDGLDVKMNPLYPSWNGISWGFLDNVTVFNRGVTETQLTPPVLEPLLTEPATSEVENSDTTQVGDNNFTPENVQTAEQVYVEEVVKKDAEAGQFLREQNQKRVATTNAQTSVEKLTDQLEEADDKTVKNRVEKQLKQANKELTEIQEEQAIVTEGEKGLWTRITTWFSGLWNSLVSIF